ncbi:dihydropteroate synthase [Leuconostocaceae bacterium ESL0723]|nr:dihydropteroate synthase [Leuconostocaceae bacterium ESL0723]
MQARQLNPETYNPLHYGSQLTIEIHHEDQVERDRIANNLVYHHHSATMDGDRLLIAVSYKELGQIIEELSFDFGPLAEQLRTIWEGQRLSFDAGNQSFDISAQPLIHAILNLSPESFYDGQEHNVDEVLKRVQGHYDQGIRFFDIGGKSTNPKAKNIGFEEEWARLEPYIKPLLDHFPGIILSVDSNNHKTVRKALDAGVQVINSIDGFDDPNMLDLVSEYQVSVITTYNNRDKPTADVPASMLSYLADQVKTLKARGLTGEQIIVDPGVGFTSNQDGITLEDKAGQDVDRIKTIQTLADLKQPILVGVSNKSFLGTLYDLPLNDRLIASLLVEYQMVMTGGRIVRVHNIEETQLLTKIFNTFAP